MGKIVFSLMLIIGGLIFVYLGIYNTYSRATKNDFKDSSILKKKHNKLQSLLKIITGSCFIVLGTILILNIVTEELISTLAVLILFSDSLSEFLISKKYKQY